ncbi:hypothetical protein E6W39_02560 [Kitasatospora acidiphila]|uniref:DUF6545 domain-containing protein n=1 Tax=Kitasatospora acidiphila TaxID=2567942 RepID=A0A540VYY8_9ACTN|nr:DUF6545 domain-containing protein [Kitasatospora acidiphila]TQF01324.1 hypothetical protein E6W39_02560 [Kitasatospora acidiphila]
MLPDQSHVPAPSRRRHWAHLRFGAAVGRAGSFIRNTTCSFPIGRPVLIAERIRVTDLKLFRTGANGSDIELHGSTVALEVELQRRVEASMEAMLGIRFVASEYPTGPWHRGRIGSLGLDENGTPVILEYKKGSDHGVVTQAVSYLSWLKSSRHEFQALVREKLGAEAAESIDWRNNPRVVCIAADFFRHDRTAIHLMGQRIDLVRYRVFEGGLLSLLLVESAPGTAASAIERAGGSPAEASNSAETVLAEPPAPLRALYEELCEALTRSGDVEVEAKFAIHPIPAGVDSVLNALLALVPLLLISVGSTRPTYPKARATVRYHHFLIRLHPLWEHLSEAAPQIRYGRAQHSLRDVLDPRGVRDRLYRRTIEIRDAILILNGDAPISVRLAAADFVDDAGLTGPTATTAAEACWLRAVREAHTAGVARAGSPEAPAQAGADLATEADLLLKLSDAYFSDLATEFAQAHLERLNIAVSGATS